MSKNEFFHKINVTELRDGITSLRGIHEQIHIYLHCNLIRMYLILMGWYQHEVTISINTWAELILTRSQK